MAAGGWWVWSYVVAPPVAPEAPAAPVAPDAGVGIAGAVVVGCDYGLDVSL